MRKGAKLENHKIGMLDSLRPLNAALMQYNHDHR